MGREVPVVAREPTVFVTVKHSQGLLERRELRPTHPQCAQLSAPVRSPKGHIRLRILCELIGLFRKYPLIRLMEKVFSRQR